MPDGAMTGLGSTDPVRIGFFGKLPSRGDFVRAGLSRAITMAWDCWLQDVLPTAHEELEASLGRAPVWRFGFGAGVCGPRAACGLLLPSADRVGRGFPLRIAAESAMTSDAFLDTAEHIGLAAIREAMSPEMLALHLRNAPRPLPASATCRATRWWRRVGASEFCELIDDALPDAATFLRMLSR
jgi:type VI secretion system protein ImpM